MSFPLITKCKHCGVQTHLRELMYFPEHLEIESMCSHCYRELLQEVQAFEGEVERIRFDAEVKKYMRELKQDMNDALNEMMQGCTTEVAPGVHRIDDMDKFMSQPLPKKQTH